MLVFGYRKIFFTGVAACMSVAMLLVGCGSRSSSELEEYKSSMTEFYDKLSYYDRAINGIDASSDNAKQQLLGYLDEIPVCTGYEIDGEVTTDFPVTSLLAKAKPVLKVMKGWKCDIRGIREFEDLPQEAQDYVNFIEEQIGYPITMVSNGPERHEIIYR